MNTLTTHVLDTTIGKPAQGIRVVLERGDDLVGEGVTDADGRQRDLIGKDAKLEPGDYTLTFYVADYFAKAKRETFYKQIAISFTVAAGSQHYHVPLLLSPFGYSTYRGS